MSDRNEMPRSAWQEHQIEQLRCSLRATAAQRLAWLEEMLELALKYRRYMPGTRDDH